MNTRRAFAAITLTTLTAIAFLSVPTIASSGLDRNSVLARPRIDSGDRVRSRDRLLARPQTGSGVVVGSRPGGASRSIGLCNKDLVQTLLFQNQMGKTVAAQPTFFWHLSEQSNANVSFMLSDPSLDKPVYEKTFIKPAAGFMQIQLPAGVELSPGRQYYWSVTLVCDPRDKSKNMTAEGMIERIPASSELAQQLASAPSNQARSQIYAQNGLWYDALATLWASTASRSDHLMAPEPVLNFLHQMGHVDVVEQVRSRP